MNKGRGFFISVIAVMDTIFVLSRCRLSRERREDPPDPGRSSSDQLKTDPLLGKLLRWNAPRGRLLEASEVLQYGSKYKAV